MNLFGLAVRNVLRNRRRTTLNAIAIAIGVAIMLVCLGWVQGYGTYIFGAVIRYQTGVAQLLNAGYQAQAERFPLDLTVTGYRAVKDQLLGLPGVSAVCGRIDFPA
ncbi:MAG TPA: hypothetical protein VMC79_10135, partial [Rectinemataceae bacterium]|nr:hypothetical protein [Rectinemataceae bacterium]